MKSINEVTKRFLYNTKIQEGEEGFEGHLSDEEEALRQLNGLIESIATGNNTYQFKMFVADVNQAVEEILLQE